MTDQETRTTSGERDTPNTADTSSSTPEDASNETAAELQARVAELEDLWRRALADLDNLRKRMARDLDQLRAEERARVAAEWLPIVDNLELALEHAQADPQTIIDGVRFVRDQAIGLLERLGFQRRDDLGETFDPARHEAVSAVAGTDSPSGTVVHVVRPGYGEGDNQLRPAAVVVATGQRDGA
jgi:molecular chaperone GrpE